MNGEKGFLSSERELNKKLTHKVSCLYFLWFVCESIGKLKKLLFLQDKKKGHTKWVLPFSCNFMKNAKQYAAVLFFTLQRRYLSNVKTTENSINILYFLFNFEYSGFLCYEHGHSLCQVGTT